MKMSEAKEMMMEIVGQENVITKMDRDIRNLGTHLDRDNARHLVNAFYQMQDNRIRFAGQVRSKDNEEPNELLGWFKDQSHLLEKQIESVMDKYTMANPVGRWMRKHIYGLGPIMTAGLVSHIDMSKVDKKGRPIQYAGQIWSYAGLINTEWSKGTKRPWNAELKKLCWKIGEQFPKQARYENDVYGKLMAQKKAEEWAKNLSGEYSDIASQKTVGKGTEAWKWYNGKIDPVWAKEELSKITGTNGYNWPANYATVDKGLNMLPPAHIHARARRWIVKLFLSHLLEVMYIDHNGKRCPDPYIIKEGHTGRIGVPFLAEWLHDEGIVL